MSLVSCCGRLDTKVSVDLVLSRHWMSRRLHIIVVEARAE